MNKLTKEEVLHVANLARLDLSEEEIKSKVLSLDSIKARIEGKEIKKVIVIKNKIVNIVAI